MKFALEKLVTDGKAITLINMGVVVSLAWAASLYANIWVSAQLAEVPEFRPPQITKTALPQKKADYSIIRKRNIFNPAAVPEEPEKAAALEKGATGKDLEGEFTPTALNLKLHGTVIANNPQNNAAVIEDPVKKKQTLYHLKDEVAPKAVIVQIERFRVLIDNAGRLESLSMELEDMKNSSPGRIKSGRKARGVLNSAFNNAIRKIGDNQVIVDKRYLDSQLKNMNKLMVDIRAVPEMNKDGYMEGFKVFQIKKGSIYDRLGLKNKDVIQQINGQPLDSAQKGLDLFMALKNESRFTVDLMRNDKKQTLSIEVQ